MNAEAKQSISPRKRRMDLLSPSLASYGGQVVAFAPTTLMRG
jgi:hypothetical protein